MMRQIVNLFFNLYQSLTAGISKLDKFHSFKYFIVFGLYICFLFLGSRHDLAFIFSHHRFI